MPQQFRFNNRWVSGDEFRRLKGLDKSEETTTEKTGDEEEAKKLEEAQDKKDKEAQDKKDKKEKEAEELKYEVLKPIEYPRGTAHKVGAVLELTEQEAGKFKTGLIKKVTKK